MRKQVRQYLRRSLCGILSAAMILAGSIIPDISVLAAQTAVEDTAENNDADVQVNETPSVENTDAVQNPDAADGNADGNEGDKLVEETTGENETGDENVPEQPEGDISEGDDVASPVENTVPGDEENEGDSEDDDTVDSNIKDDGVTGGVADDDKVEEVSDEVIAVTAEGGPYNDVKVNLNYYVGELGTDETVGFYKWSDPGGEITINTAVNPLLSWGGWGDAKKNPVYQMQSVVGHTGWYNITFTVTDTLTDTGSLTGFSVFRSGSTGSQIFESSGYVEPEIYAGLLSGKMTAVKGKKGYASIEDAEVSTEALAELVAEAKKLDEDEYKAYGWKAFSEALTTAEEVLEKETPTSSEVQKAYENLKKAMDSLVPKSSVEAEINVKPIALAEDFITGADISSYWSLRQSGTIFKDENGNELSDAEFFQYLHDGGTNWIRIRVWNDPYDSEGHGYGGGNNDLAKAKIMGKLATDAGMKVLIDFHYSDFWADPGKQQAPKAWKDRTVDEKADLVYQFTLDSLNELKSAGVNVGMVQVGNETTNGICGVTYKADGWAAAAKIYNAGSKAVREFDKDCLVAVHFTNPERSGNYASLAKSLNDQKVDYDVFASSYYPFWHGTTDNLTSVLANVAKTYGKKVMVAETSWATTLDDQDGHDNTVRNGQNDKGQPYAFSVQGQADEIRAVVEAANNVNNVAGAAGSSIGVFYWESAWLSPYYAYNEDGTKNEELYNRNKAAWEEYGSGWAAIYGGEYDPEDAGKWYGGSAVDNQAWFGFDGTALPTAKVYSYIRTGATAEKAVSEVENPSVTVKAGGMVEYPEKVTVTFNDGTTAECPVEWNQEDQAQVDTREPGDHTVRGIATCEYIISDGSTRTATRSVTFTITVEMVLEEVLVNPGFEDADMSAWTIKGSGTARKDEDPRTGTYGVHFYNANAVTSTVMQRIENLAAGTYVFGGYIQGDAAGTTAEAVVKVYDGEGNLKDTKTASCTTAGWCVWQNPEITGIVVGEGDSLEVGMEVNASAGGWGTMDDFYLYSAFEYDILIDDQIKHGTLSCSVEKSVAGETITLKVVPDDGYILSKLTVSGRSVTGATLTSEHGTVSYDNKTKTVILTYADRVAEATEESFTMPNSKVTVSAVFRTDVDLSGLNKVIDEYENVTYDGYTEESWKAFTDALEAAKKAAENLEATQTEIDSAREALETAYDGLEKAPLATQEEIAALKSLIEEYGKLTSDGYTEESWKNFADALEAAKAAAEKENVTQAEVDSAKVALEAAYKGLTKAPAGEEDLTALNALIEEYEKVTNDGYTEESWKTFTAALAAAKEAVKKENVTQSEVGSAKATLEAAYKGLTKASDPEPGEEVDLTALNALIAQYESVTNDGYTEESWKTFTAALAAAKEAAKKENATQAEINSAKAALEAAYKGLTKASTGVVDLTALNALIAKYDSVTNDGYTKESWKTFTDALAAAKEAAKKENVTQAEVDSAKATLEKAYTGLVKATNPAREGLWAEWADEWAELLSNDNTITYTGKAIKPTVKVYDGETLLTSSSYSVSYQNNTKVGEAGVIIKGKGNYTGSCTMKFKIDYVDLENDSDVSITNLYVAASKNGNPVSVKPVVTWKGKKVNAKLYDVVLPDKSEGAYVAPGTYNVEVKAKENNGIYKGSREIKITLVDISNDAQVLMSSVKVKFNFKSMPWKEGGVTLDSSKDIMVTYKNEPLEENTNYTLDYENNDQIGTATVIITGTGTPENKGRFVGELRKTFKITGTAIKAADVKLNIAEPIVYNGTDHEPAVQIEGLKENTDFEVTYQNNRNAGKKATAIITGINGYSGTVKKTFTIAAHDVNQADVNIVVNENAPVAYEKGGSKPPVEVIFDGGILVPGTDYTVSYAKNAKVTEGATAEVRITGKGNFTQKKTLTFAIGKQSLEELKATAADQTNPKKWNKVSPVITDLNGKALKKGTDYEKTFTYKLYDANNAEVTDTAEPAVGMRVEVTATGKGSYEGMITAEYRIIDSKQSIAKARITVTPQTYTGEAIELSKDAIKLELKDGSDWKPLSADQYEIVGYSNNINKGKAAKVTIHGLAPYGGTKTVKFEIKAQSMEGISWAERIASMFERMFN